MTITENKTIQPGYEPIKGYVLEKRIGRGGYGEVWRAEAPGGLKKAVKFVYGQHDERRATQELKSLERIKGVQHPFILTLERFELINNQLVIVTELADGSLEDVYKEHCDRGSCGIPRQALLGYMRDAADALDYLHQLYKLQHLDIKPANLLMVGGRVKVADFGLLKDLGEVDCSIVGGLTPIYAPPELFDGRPSMNTDQYSLAVMYQELLTSTRPFAGRTIAQLATQHVHNAPNLDPLPACDRPCVARALEKNPERRFESCTQFVNKLFNPQGSVTTRGAELDADGNKPEHEVENLPQIALTNSSAFSGTQTRALVIALGGTGADCLYQLRSRIFEYGAATPLVLQSVLIDTDALTTQSAAMVDELDYLPKCRTVYTRLRSAKQYRESGTERFRSISRRWIYNVPRNAATGGMRPLGRLALIDHSDRVVETLKRAIEDLKSSLAEGEDAKIYVVTSLSGGTGSGMYLDIVHLLRHFLDEAAMENQEIISLLTTNRFQGDPSKPLALHTTRSAIQELAHFMKPGNGYPGDEGAGWPSLPAARTPLHNAYIVAESSDIVASSAIDSAVSYLWSDATVGNEWFAQARHEAQQEKSGVVTLRSFGVVQIGDVEEERSSLLAPYTAKSVLLQWLGNPNESDEAASELLGRVKRRCHLNAELLRGKAEQWFGRNGKERRQTMLEHLRTVDLNIVENQLAVRSYLIDWLTSAVDLEQSEIIVDQMAEQIRHEITLRLGDARLDLSSTIAALNQVSEFAETLNKELMKLSELDFQKLESRTPTAPAVGNAHTELPRDTAFQDACQVGEILIGVIGCRVAAAITVSLQSKLEELVEVYSDASVLIAQAIQNLTEDLSWSADPWEAMEQPVQDRQSDVLSKIRSECFNQVLLRAINTPVLVSRESIVGELTDAASTAIRSSIDKLSEEEQSTATDAINEDGTATQTDTQCLQPGGSELSTDSVTTASSADPVSMTQTCTWNNSRDSRSATVTVEAAIDAVRPPLLDCGGKQRHFLLCRNEREESELITRFPESIRDSVTTILARTSLPTLIHEAQAIDVKNILAWLDSLTGDNGKIGARLASRSDVQW